MNSSVNQTRRDENPRTTRVRQVVLDAAVDLLLNHGAAAVTATRVGQQTRVARTTIYRHWPDPASLLLDTIDMLVAPHHSTTLTDNLRADLTTAIADLRTRMMRQPFRQVFAALLDHANRDRAFSAAQRRFVKGVIRPIEDVLAAGRERGELPAGVDLANALALLSGPIFYQHVMVRAAVDDDLIADTIDRFLKAESVR